MSLTSLHDRVRRLGLGTMFEKHWANGGFRDLFDITSAEWEMTALPEKVIDLEAFEAAGVPARELVATYCESLADRPEGPAVLSSLPATLEAYRKAGYAVPLPDDLAGATHQAQ